MTINLPGDIIIDDFVEIYVQVYDLSCKGCTIFRRNAITGVVLHAARKETRAMVPCWPVRLKNIAPPEQRILILRNGARRRARCSGDPRKEQDYALHRPRQRRAASGRRTP
jgi:hypothetical protein